MTRARKAGWMAGVAAAGLVVALAFGAGADNPPKKKKSYVLGLIAKSQSNPVFVAARTGAEDAARAWSEKLGADVKIDWRTPVSEDGQKQAEFLEQLVAAGVDGVAVSCSDASKLTLAIDSAVGKGVPIVCFDSDAPRSKRFAYFGTDDLACGREVGKELAGAMGEAGVVAILAGNQNAPNLQKRVQGVKEELAKHPKIQILDTYYHPETAQDAVAKMEQVQGANPQITGWALVGGWPLFTENALNSIAGKAKVVSVDALRPQLKYLKNGQVQVLLAQQVYEWGTQSVELLMQKLTANQQPSDPIVRAPLVRVTADNADEYEKNWARWLGEAPAAGGAGR